MKNVMCLATALVATVGFAGRQPVFHVSFEGNADATTASGRLAPAEAKEIEYASGPVGRAVRLSARKGSRIEYPVPGLINRRAGAIAFWMKPEFAEGRTVGADILHTAPFDATVPYGKGPQGGVPGAPSAVGTGAIRLWMSTPQAWFRGEIYDDRQTREGRTVRPNEWHHYIFTWDERSVDLYVDGCGHHYSDAATPMQEAIERAGDKSRRFGRHTFARPADPVSLVLGEAVTGNAAWGFDGLIDELEVFDGRIGPQAALEVAVANGVKPARPVDWTTRFSGQENRYVGKPGGRLDLELVEEVRLDSLAAVERLRKEHRLASCGEMSVKELNGVRYVELGGRSGNRLAVRFPGGKTDRALDYFEIEYPDDGFRTCDMLIQGTGGGVPGSGVGGDYSMQVGYACGHEYANSGKMQTFRTPFWMPANGTDDLTLIATTARDGQPAAIAAIRRYHVRDGRLPSVAFDLPKKVNGWNRSFALFYEDPSINYDFGAPADGYSEEGLLKTADACIATMKYTGQDLLAYPGVWYQGLIDDRDYNPRRHAPDFLEGFYARFDAAGLGVVPTFNPNSMPVPDGLVSMDSMTNGSLHSSPIAITATGLPNWGGWHNTPPNFNIQHPDVQAKILEWVDRLLEQGVRHPSFKGICFHLTRHNFLSWGVAGGGYNDYSIEAFERFAHLRVPVDRADPLRGKAYADWIRTNAWDEWCQFRRNTVSEFYAKVAARIKAARGDLKFWVNSFNAPLQNEFSYLEDNAMEIALQNMGVDGPEIERTANRLIGSAGGNVILAQTYLPCKPRWQSHRLGNGDPVYEKMKHLHQERDMYAITRWASFPWVGQHDVYWESALAGHGNELRLENGEWLNECKWRVSTINPSGRNQLEAFAVPFRHVDPLGLSKGGFLVGTYGMENEIRPFIQAFRALPAVVFKAVQESDVTVRSQEFDGKMWFYAVNTTGERRKVELEVNGVFRNLVSGAELAQGRRTLELEPWELRSFSAATGSVSVVKEAVRPAKPVAFKDAGKLKGWDAWNDHVAPRKWQERRCVNWERLVRLDPGLRYLGRVRPKSPSEIKDSNWSIGCETLDRDYGDWNEYKTLLSKLGAKHGRLFSGWAKTEQEKGRYDFSWLDVQVREMASMGMKPWLCISYGNPVWGSDFRLGMRVRQITDSPEAFAAWLRYVKTLVGRYKDVVSDWEVWNEPFRQGPEYADLFYETARAVREVQPEARVFCTAISFPDDYICVLEKLKEKNALGLGSYFIYHPYSPNPDLSYADGEGQFTAQPAMALRNLVKKYSDSFDIMQGESGCPSQLEFAHAMPEIAWTEISQAKWDLRRAMGDAVRGIPSCCFTFIDLQYTFMLQSFGLVRSNALKEPVYRRPSYRAMQNVYALFDNSIRPVGVRTIRKGVRDLTVAEFSQGKHHLFAVWFSGRRPDDNLAYETLDLSGDRVRAETGTWVDLMTGRICALPSLASVPVWDSPILLK